MHKHPASRLLIELDKFSNTGLWKLIDRKTTSNGFSKDHVVLERGIADYSHARKAFNAAKRGLIAITVAVSIPTVGQSAAPDPNSKQGERMEPYRVFVTTMKTKTGAGCCSLGDGRMGDGGEELKERRIPQPDGSIKYQVFVTRDIFGKDSIDPDAIVNQCDYDASDDYVCAKVPSSTQHHEYDKAIPVEGKWFDIPPENVIEAWQAEAKLCIREVPNCVMPPDNILWLSTEGKVYCYSPIQNFTANQMPRFAKLEPK